MYLDHGSLSWNIFSGSSCTHILIMVVLSMMKPFKRNFFLFQWIKPALPIRQRCDQYQSCMYSLMKLILVVFSRKMFCFLMLQPFFGKIWEKLNYGLFGLIWIDSQNLLYIFILSFPRKYEVWWNKNYKENSHSVIRPLIERVLNPLKNA